MPTSKTKVLPAGQRLLCEPVDQVGKTASGLFIPEKAQNRPIIMRVLGVGDGNQDTNYTGKWPPPELERTKLVLVGKFSGNEIQLEDVNRSVWVISIEEVLGYVTEL
jgi:chaperonin GroES